MTYTRTLSIYLMLESTKQERRVFRYRDDASFMKLGANLGRIPGIRYRIDSLYLYPLRSDFQISVATCTPINIIIHVHYNHHRHHILKRHHQLKPYPSIHNQPTNHKTHNLQSPPVLISNPPKRIACLSSVSQ